MRQVTTRLAEGYTPREIAAELGTSTSSVSAMLRELREELGR
jgi:DNA-binding NarL/FixJ family response regulator